MKELNIVMTKDVCGGFNWKKIIPKEINGICLGGVVGGLAGFILAGVPGAVIGAANGIMGGAGLEHEFKQEDFK